MEYHSGVRFLCLNVIEYVGAFYYFPMNKWKHYLILLHYWNLPKFLTNNAMDFNLFNQVFRRLIMFILKSEMFDKLFEKNKYFYRVKKVFF